MTDSDVFFGCATCGKEVVDGQKYWTVEVHHETLNGGIVTVHAADMIGGYCSKACLLQSGYELPGWMADFGDPQRL